MLPIRVTKLVRLVRTVEYAELGSHLYKTEEWSGVRFLTGTHPRPRLWSDTSSQDLRHLQRGSIARAWQAFIARPCKQWRDDCKCCHRQHVAVCSTLLEVLETQVAYLCRMQSWQCKHELFCHQIWAPRLLPEVNVSSSGSVMLTLRSHFSAWSCIVENSRFTHWTNSDMWIYTRTVFWSLSANITCRIEILPTAGLCMAKIQCSREESSNFALQVVLRLQVRVRLAPQYWQFPFG